MDWNFTRLGVYPMEQRGVFGIFAHPLVHSSFKHLFANTIPLFFLMWCLFYFYRHIAPTSSLPFDRMRCAYLSYRETGMAYRASGIIYGLAFFLFFSGILRKHVPLIAISLLITFLYGGLVWNMFPQFAKATTSWKDTQRSHSRHAMRHRFYGIRSQRPIRLPERKTKRRRR